MCNNIKLILQVFHLVYCAPFSKDHNCKYYYKDLCSQFVSVTSEYMPQFSKRLKNHLILHLVDDMVDFGPPDCYNTERYSF